MKWKQYVFNNPIAHSKRYNSHFVITNNLTPIIDCISKAKQQI